MLSKFETRSNRVKGISFHPKRPWILASLHNGSVQLWDYKMGTLIERFDEHEGPVRGVHFHMTQPLFVSGGDDYKIKVWNWKTRRCLFTLTGHLDYVRSVFFHHEAPWIVSASDDQTIRIWNWQSRNCISILTGHNHYVMCAQFHPSEQLVVSASLDQTVRVWDISGLKRKNAAGQPMTRDELARQSQPADIFGNTDCVNKYVLEGHARGVNWATFHPTSPLIVSGADDRFVKLWRMSDTRAWEVETFRGHLSNVSCVAFHPRKDIVISDSEDKTIRVWDISKRVALQTFRREHDRFWVLAAHPELNIFAAGHDSGLIVFKLERERVPFALYQEKVIYCKNMMVRVYDLATGQDTLILSIARMVSAGPPRTLSYNPVEHSILVGVRYPDGSNMYGLVKLPRNADGQPYEVTDSEVSPQSGRAVFIARNRFATVSATGANEWVLYVKDLSYVNTREIPLTGLGPITGIFYAGAKHVLLAQSHSVVLYDLELKTVAAELAVMGVRYVHWSPDMSMVALLSKHTVSIATKDLQQQCLLHETIKIKSGCWDEIGVFVYSTLNHIKYTLPQGDSGIICTVERPVYVVRVRGASVHCFDHEGAMHAIKFDPNEYRFKLALQRRNYAEVLRIIRSSNLVGQAIIAYLEKKGYPEVALHFVKDVKTRFELAIECSNLDVAVEMAKSLDSEACWNTLAAEALRQGNAQVVELAYQRTKAFDRLSFLYFCLGDLDKLTKMLKIAEMRGDCMSRYHNALYLGNVEEHVRIFEQLGRSQLAYLAAKTYGLEEQAANILEVAGDGVSPILPDPEAEEGSDGTPGARLLKPPMPILRALGDQANWPQLKVAKSFFESALLGLEPENPLHANTTLDQEAMRDTGASGDWAPGAGDDPFSRAAAADVPAGVAAPGAAKPAVAQGGGWGDLDEELDAAVAGLGLGPDTAGEAAAGAADAGAAAPGVPVEVLWTRSSQVAADHAAAGHFGKAMELLHAQAGITQFAPLKPAFLLAFSAARSYLQIDAPAPALVLPLHRNPDCGAPERLRPAAAIGPRLLQQRLGEAHALTTAGRFAEALPMFRQVLHLAPLCVTDGPAQHQEWVAAVAAAREYIVGLRLENARKDAPADTPAGAKRAAELACYFTHCAMLEAHVQAAVRSAMIATFKLKNLGTAAQLAQRLLESSPAAQVADQARKVLQICQQQSATDALQLDYDAYRPFVVCAGKLAPLYRGGSVEPVRCAFCGAFYSPEFSGRVCGVCDVAEVGRAAPGVVTFDASGVSGFSAGGF